jgi:hypothetical protein
MNVRGRRPAMKRRRTDHGGTLSSKPEAPGTDWELADDRLDEALRDTFPASDALSIVQGARRA